MAKFNRGSKVIVYLMLLLLSAIVISSQIFSSVQASESERLIMEALPQIQVAQPGQIVKYSYSTFNRMPPLQLEPRDPYHRPYKELWSSYETQESWIEIGADNKIARWRTKLFNQEGVLLQDLLFDGVNETGYFLLEERAYRSPTEGGVYRDEQVVLLEMFRKSVEASPRKTTDVNGESVLSVYTKAKSMTGSPQEVQSALLSLSRPFIADLKLTSLANRIDFSPSTHLPIGDGEVVVDQTGVEHIISYRKLIAKEIIIAEGAQNEALFTQTIPQQAFSESIDVSLHVQTIVGMDNILKAVTYPVYDLAGDGETSLKQVAASLVIPNDDYSPPQTMRGILWVPSYGPGINTVYTDNTIVVSIIQGRTAEMQTVFQQTPPHWINAEQANLLLGQQQVPVWILSPLEADRKYYVVEAGETLLYIDSQGLSTEQLANFLSKFTFLQPQQATFKTFVPFAQQ
jgi:hypothetical protein